MSMLPAGYSPTSCEPTGAPKDALAKVVCTRNADAGGPAGASYTLVGEKASLTRVFDAALRGSRIVTAPETSRSSHCLSSTKHTSGCSSATSDSRLNTPSPTKNRSGTGPELMPKAVRTASRCGAGKRCRPTPSRGCVTPNTLPGN
jgi:hypothetical protein